MGKAVVYCTACGKSFREEAGGGGDSLCRACRPAEPSPRPTPRSSAAIPPLSITPRRARAALPAASSRGPLLAAAGLALGLLLVVGIAFSAPGRRTEPPTTPAPHPSPAPTPRPAPAAPSARSDAGEVERRMRETQEREEAARFDAYLKQIGELIRGGAAAGRRSEIEAMLDSARRRAGGRRSEVDALAAELAARLAAPPALPAELTLQAAEARLTGDRIAVKERDGIRYIGNWNRTTDQAEWTLRAPRAGRYRLFLDYAASTLGGGRIAAEFGTERVEADLAPTGDWRTFRTLELGAVGLPAGELVVRFRAVRLGKEGLMNFRTLRLAAE